MSVLRTKSLGIKQGFPAYAGPVLSIKTRRRLLEEEQIDYSKSGRCYLVYTIMTAEQFEKIMAKFVAIDGGQLEFAAKTPTMVSAPVDVGAVLAEALAVKVEKPATTIADLINAKLEEKREQQQALSAFALPDPRKADRFLAMQKLYDPVASEAIGYLCDRIRTGFLAKNLMWIKPGHIAWAIGQKMFDDGMTAEQFADKEFCQWETGRGYEEVREHILGACRPVVNGT